MSIPYFHNEKFEGKRKGMMRVSSSAESVPSRRLGPFWHDIPDLERRLHRFAYNSNKRGIIINFETQGARDIFRELVKKTHFVIESSSLVA